MIGLKIKIKLWTSGHNAFGHKDWRIKSINLRKQISTVNINIILKCASFSDVGSSTANWDP